MDLYIVFRSSTTKLAIQKLVFYFFSQDWCFFIYFYFFYSVRKECLKWQTYHMYLISDTVKFFNTKLKKDLIFINSWGYTYLICLTWVVLLRNSWRWNWNSRISQLFDMRSYFLITLISGFSASIQTMLYIQIETRTTICF